MQQQQHFTHLTSALFLVPALRCPGTWLRPWFAALAATSFAHHALYHVPFPGKAALAAVDRAIAHAIALRTAGEALRLPPSAHVLAYWLCMAYVALGYYCVMLRRPGLSTPMHETIHAAAVAGTLALRAAPGWPA